MFLIAAKRRVALGLALALWVGLLTVLFSFLGTIACAGVVGLMFGASRVKASLCDVTLVSFIFPAAIVGYLVGWKSDFTTQQTCILPAICFACFWVMYGLSRILVYIERGAVPASGQASAGPPSESGSVSSTPPAVLPVLEGELDLQGLWAKPLSDGQEGACTKLVEIIGDHLAVRLLKANGETECISQAQVSATKLGPYNVLTLRYPSPPNDGAPTETWLYRVTCHQLTVARHFEYSADGHVPELESYLKRG